MHIFKIGNPYIGDSDEHYINVYKAVPAEEMLPDWFKNLPNLTDQKDFTSRTGKSCRGIYDMMTMGYIFKWTQDMVIEKDDMGRHWIRKERDAANKDFAPHKAEQMGGYPHPLMAIQAEGVQKYLTPYHLNTPKGTSIMMIQPSYRPDLKTEIMPGIVDTDKYYTSFNILFMIKDIGDRKRVKIPAGTPLAQVIPFQRSEWTIEYGPVDDKLYRTILHNTENLEGYYGKHLWTRKFFKRKK